MIYKRASLSRRRMIRLLAHPLPPPPTSLASKLVRRHSGRLRKKDDLMTGEGEGGGSGAESYDYRKAWSSINHIELSAQY
jgi:hypothetical protein